MQSPRKPWKGYLLCGAALGQASGGRAAPPWSDSAPQRPPLAIPALRAGPRQLGADTERRGCGNCAPEHRIFTHMKEGLGGVQSHLDGKI